MNFKKNPILKKETNNSDLTSNIPKIHFDIKDYGLLEPTKSLQAKSLNPTIPKRKNPLAISRAIKNGVMNRTSDNLPA